MKEFNSKYSPVNVHNDEQMVRECLRLPKLQIDRKAFQKSYSEKEELWRAKLVWRPRCAAYTPEWQGLNILAG